MTLEQTECFFLRFFRMFLLTIGIGLSLGLVLDYFLSALVKVHIEKDQLLDSWHIIHLLQVKVNFVPSSTFINCMLYLLTHF
jgi:uncharacterized membrane protein